MRTVRQYFTSSLLLNLLRCLLRTGKYLFAHKITVQYPAEKTPQSPRFRGLHVLRFYPNGEERCIACKVSEAVCPALTITIEAEPREDGTPHACDIDLFRRIYCGFCGESCPVDTIVETRIFDLYFEERGQQIINKEQLLAIGERYQAQIDAHRAVHAPYR